ncbi:hypothetical protein CIB84_000020, partial [Bambusicola thoracicus]
GVRGVCSFKPYVAAASRGERRPASPSASRPAAFCGKSAAPPPGRSRQCSAPRAAHSGGEPEAAATPSPPSERAGDAGDSSGTSSVSLVSRFPPPFHACFLYKCGFQNVIRSKRRCEMRENTKKNPPR